MENHQRSWDDELELSIPLAYTGEKSNYRLGCDRSLWDVDLHQDADVTRRIVSDPDSPLDWGQIERDLNMSYGTEPESHRYRRRSHRRKKSHSSASTIDHIEKSWGKNAKTFGISKSGLTRAILHFNKPPISHPMTVCFHFPPGTLTHAHVIRLMGGLIGPFKGSKVTSLTFVDRNVIHGTRGLDNRWLVTLNTDEARDYLVNSGLPLFNRVIDIKLYDDVMQEEHESFLKYLKIQKHLNPKLNEITSE